MAYVELGDFFAIAKILAVLLASGFALYFPLVAWLKNKKNALALTIPASISVEIIFGYIFYSFDATSFFPGVYLAVIIILNVLAILKIKKANIQSEDGWKFKIQDLALFLVVAAAAFYTRFYDAIKNIAPGGIDTPAHITYLKEMSQLGHLGSGSYPPGFHLTAYPLLNFVGYTEIYRFAGPSVGILIFLALWLLARTFLKKKLSVILLLTLFCFPLFNQLILQTIYFYPSSLSFILFPALLYLLTFPNHLPRKQIFLLYALFSLALALSVPYLYVQYLPAAALLTVIVLVSKNIFNWRYRSLMLGFVIISLAGLLACFGHVFLRAKIVKSGAFPEIATVENRDGEIKIGTNYERIDRSGGTFTERLLLPAYATAKETLRVKNFRPSQDLLSVGAYLWTVISLLLLVYALKKRDKIILVFAVFSLAFGFMTQTGVLEMSFYRGRSGWYLLILALVGLALIFDEGYRDKFKKIFYPLLGALYLACFLAPPTFYRPYFTDPFEIAYKIKKDLPGQEITFIAEQNKINLISDSFTVLPFTEESMWRSNPHGRTFIIIENKFFEKDPVLSQQAYSVDSEFGDFKKKQQSLKEELERKNARIRESEAFKAYQKYYENENISVYLLI